MKLYGTLTSPYVRRVRIVAAELGEPFAFVDTTTDEGQAALRAATPLWKVPTAELEGTVVFDSHAIVDRLVELRGAGPLRAVDPATRWRERNLETAIDGALDAAINAFYLRRDGADPAKLPYLAKQLARVGSAMGFVARELAAGWLPRGALGRTEIALVTTIDWMRFRVAYDVDAHPELVAFRAALEGRPSLVSTMPVG
jgi:glutathione S-transferase